MMQELPRVKTLRSTSVMDDVSVFNKYASYSCWFQNYSKNPCIFQVIQKLLKYRAWDLQARPVMFRLFMSTLHTHSGSQNYADDVSNSMNILEHPRANWNIGLEMYKLNQWCFGCSLIRYIWTMVIYVYIKVNACFFHYISGTPWPIFTKLGIRMLYLKKRVIGVLHEEGIIPEREEGL